MHFSFADIFHQCVPRTCFTYSHKSFSFCRFKEGIIILLRISLIKALGCLYGIWNLDFFRTVIPCTYLCDGHQSNTSACFGLCDCLLSIGTGYSDLLSCIAMMYTTIIVVWMWRPFHFMIFSFVSQNWDIWNGRLLMLLQPSFYLKINFSTLLLTCQYS